MTISVILRLTQKILNDQKLLSVSFWCAGVMQVWLSFLGLFIIFTTNHV